MAMHNRGDGAPHGRLLLIEGDEPHARLVAETLSQSLGASIRIAKAAGGRQAAELLRETGFDIVLADLSSLRDLSERNGHSAEFTRRLEALRQAHATKPNFLAPLTKARL